MKNHLIFLLKCVFTLKNMLITQSFLLIQQILEKAKLIQFYTRHMLGRNTTDASVQFLKSLELLLLYSSFKMNSNVTCSQKLSLILYKDNPCAKHSDNSVHPSTTELIT